MAQVVVYEQLIIGHQPLVDDSLEFIIFCLVIRSLASQVLRFFILS